VTATVDKINDHGGQRRKDEREADLILEKVIVISMSFGKRIMVGQRAKINRRLGSKLRI
jgi:hypothetical protein